MYDKEAHYRIEKGLAAQLCNAPREQRLALYTTVYDTMFANVPGHPQLVPPDPVSVANENKSRWNLLKRYAGQDKNYIEFGAGDGSFCKYVAHAFRHVYAVDCSRVLETQHPGNNNITRIVQDCSARIDLPEPVDVACSANLLEHLHPEDCRLHLDNVQRMLTPGGVYCILVPNRCGGPNDVSRDFDDTATCFHLNERTASEMARYLTQAGFRGLRLYLCVSYRSVRLPLGSVRLPLGLVRLVENLLLRPLNQVRFIAQKGPGTTE